MRLPRLLIGLILGLVACLAAGLGPLSADESAESTGPVDPAVVTLQPGENLVGWLGEPLPVAQLKQRLPAIESVSAWEPLTGQFYEPASLLAGQGYIVTLAGTEAVQWRRPMMPVKGKVTLHRGRNLVTWLGPDDWTIDRVALGIGRELVRAEWEGGEYTPAETRTAESLPTLKRGAAIWVEVSRTVNWLQPAGVMPQIKFAGAVSSEVRAEVRRDSVEVMNHFANRFSLQPDGSILTVYVAADVESLVEVFAADGLETRGVHETWYKSGGWANSAGYIVLKTEQWKPDYGSRRLCEHGECAKGRAVMAHEYFHSIQQQLSNTEAPTWLVEGGADWAEAGLILQDADSTYDSELVSNRTTTYGGYSWADGPPLDHTERRHDKPWAYTLGAIASQRLALRSGEQSLVEFWRALLPMPLGPLGRWSSDPPWQSVFFNVFDITVDDFYGEFAEWRGGLAANSVKGRVIGPDGEGLPYVKVVGRSQHLPDEYHYDYTETLTDGHGNFDLAVNELGVIQVGVDLGGCAVYYSDGGIVSLWADADEVDASTRSSQNLRLRLSEQHCVWRINGRVVDRGNVLPASQQINVDTGHANGNAAIGSDGRFSITVPVSGVYLMRVYIDECGYYYNESATSGSRDNATDIVVVDSDVDGINFVISETACSAGISGRLLDADGQPMSDVWVNVRTESSWGPGDHTDADGAFDISIADSGLYILQAQINGCWTYYRRGSATPNQKQASWISVDDEVVRVAYRLPRGLCSINITGKVLDANGDPITKAQVFAESDDKHAWGDVMPNGSFSVTVPESGRYRVTARIDGCDVRYRRGGVTGRWDLATQVRVSDEDVTGLTIQLAEGMCEHRISGRLLNADGSPHVGRWTHVSGPSGAGGAESSADGSFSIVVRTNGTYRLSVGTEFGDCRIRYRKSGPTKVWESATGITISNKDVSDIEFRLPADEESFCR